MSVSEKDFKKIKNEIKDFVEQEMIPDESSIDHNHRFEESLPILEEKRNKVKKMGYSQAFINMWEFYFLYCEAGFTERNIGDVQLVFAKSKARDLEVKY